MANAKVRLGVAFDGEKEVKTAVANINAQLKTLKSEAEKVKSAFAGQEKSEEALIATSKVLSRTIDAEKSKIKEMSDAVKKAVEHEKDLAKRKEELPALIEKESQKLVEMKSKMETSSDAIKEQEDLVKRLRKEWDNIPQTMTKANTNTERWKKSLADAETELNKTQKELNQTNSELGEMSGKADKAGKEMDDMADSSGKVGKHLSAAGVAFGTFIGNLASDALRKAASAMKTLATSTIQVGMDFDAAMSKVAAVSGASGDAFDKLRAKAREMGATTKFTAEESADALNYMAMAGWKTEEMVSGINGVMNLAAASGEDLATTSDIVTDALSAFGMNARDSAHFADILAAASANANTNVSMMGETFKYAAPVAGALGYSAEDVAEAIGLMANSGIKASQAGTGLRTIMTKLNKDFTISGKELGKVKIATTNADGSMRELSDILGDTRAAFSKLSESEKAQAAQSLVGKNAMSAFLALMQAAPADVDKLKGAIQNCDGAAKKMADTMSDNLKGDIDKLKSAWQDLQIELSDTAKGPLRDIVQTVTNDVIPAFKALVTNSEHTAGKIRNAFTNIGDKIGNIGGNIISSFFGDRAGQAVKDGFKVITETVKDLMGVFKDLGPAVASVIEGSSSFTQHIMPVIVDLIRTLAPLLESITSLVSKVIQSVMPAVSSALHGINDSLKPIIDALNPIFDIVGKIFEELAPLFKSIGDLVGNVIRLAAALDPVTKVLQLIAPLIELIGNLLKPIFDFVKLISDGLNWVVEGFMSLIGCGVDKSLEEDRQAMEDFAAECDTAREQMDSLRRSRDDSLNGISAEYEGYQKLIKELDGYIDKNGQVKDGYQDRAQTIIDQLKSQFGTEIEMVDGCVQSWDKLRASIEKEMKTEQLRAQVNANADLRAQAADVQWMSEQYDLLAEAQANADKAERDLQDAMAKGKGVDEAKANFETMQRAVYDVEQTIGHAQKALDDFDLANAALASGKVKDLDKAIGSMNQSILDGRYLSTSSLGLQLKDLAGHAMQSADIYSKTGAEIHQIQAKNFYEQGRLATKFYEESAEKNGEALAEWKDLEEGRLEFSKQISDEIWKGSDMTIHGKRTNETYAKGQASSSDKPVKEQRNTNKKVREAALDGADQTSVGEKQDTTMAGGITANSVKPIGAAKAVVESTNKAAEEAVDTAPAGQKADSDFADSLRIYANWIYNEAVNAAQQADIGLGSGDSYSVGMNVALGMARGIRDYAPKITAAGVAAVGDAIVGMRNKADEASPSKETRKIGQFLSIGAALGISDRAKEVEKTATDMMATSIDAMRKEAEINSPSKKTQKLGQQLMDGLAVGVTSRMKSTATTMRNAVNLVLKNAQKTVESYTKNGNYDGAGDRLTSLASSGISSAGTATLKAVTKDLNNGFNAIKKTFNSQIKTLTANSKAKIKSLNKELAKAEKNSSASLKNLEKQIDKAEKDHDEKIKRLEKTRDKKLKSAKDDSAKKEIKDDFKRDKKTADEKLKSQKKLYNAQIKIEKSRIKAREKSINKQIKAEEKATKKSKSALEKQLKTVADNQTKIVDAAKKQIEGEVKTLTTYMEQELDRISTKYQEKYDEIKAKNDALRSTLENSTSERFTESTDRRGHVTVALSSLAAQTKKINDYMANLKKVRTQITNYVGGTVAQSLIDEIVGMSVDDGNKYMTAILKLSSKSLKTYATDYKKQLSTIAGYTSTNLSSKTGFYTAQFKEIKAGYDKEIKNLQNTISKKFTDVGINAAKAFASGTKSNQTAVVNAVKSLGTAAIKQLKKTLGIKSPSRVFKEMGLMTDKGLAIGIDDNAKLAIDAIGRMSDNMISAMDGTSERLAISAGGARALARRQNMTAVQERPIVVITEIDGKQVGYATAKYVTRQQNFERRGQYA